MTEEQPPKDPTKTPDAPKVEGETMPPAGGESMQPSDSKHPFAGPQDAPKPSAD